MRIVSGSTTESVYFVAFSTADHVTRVTGLTSFNVYCSVAGSTGSTHAITVTEINSTQMPGVYRALIADSTITTLSAGIDSRELCLHITSSMDPVTRSVELYRRPVTTGATITVDSSGAANANVVEIAGAAPSTGTAHFGVNVVTLAADAITAASIADGAITSTSFAANSITASALAADAVAEITTDILANLTTVLNKVTSADTNIASVLTKLTSVETDVDSVLTKATSIDTDIDTALTGLSSLGTHMDTALSRLSSIDTDIDTALTRLSSLGTHVDTALTRLSSIDTDIDTALTRMTSVDTKVTAIQAQTTQLRFTSTYGVDANIQSVNEVGVQGVGTTTDTWRPV